MERHYSYLVCTRCFTYNHETYILDTLNGFVVQNTSFPVVYAIVDDASTDNTPQILRDYFNEYFDTGNSSVARQENTDYGTVLFARHKENSNCYFAIILLKENHRSQIKAKKPYLIRWMEDAKYIAFCEGDDYWTDPMKLQRQVDMLEQNDDVVMCCTACEIKTDEGITIQRRYRKARTVPTEHIIKLGGLWLHTVTYIFRSSLMDSYPACCKGCHVGDYPRILWAAMNGSVYYLPDVTAVYRFQGGGSWTSKQRSVSIDRLIAGWRSEVDMLKGLDQYSKGKYTRAFNDRIQSYLYDAIINHQKETKRITDAFREEIKLFDRKKKFHLLAIKMHLGAVYEFFRNFWRSWKKNNHNHKK